MGVEVEVGVGVDIVLPGVTYPEELLAYPVPVLGVRYSLHFANKKLR